VILAGETPSPHPNYNRAVFSPMPPLVSMDLPTSPASAPVASTTHGTSATKHTPPLGGTGSPPPFLNIPLVFDILNLYQAQWFLSWEIINKNIVMAQKDMNGTFTWVKLAPQYHSFLIQLGLWLIPHPLTPERPRQSLFKLVSWVIFVFILEILLEGPQKGFFDLLKNLHKAAKMKK
jgi:hypothetical protein